MSQETKLSAGTVHEGETRVEAAITAPRYVPGTPDAYATPAMVALIEITSHQLVAPTLAADQTTVGGFIQTSHVAPTPIGQRVRCKTILQQIDGRKLIFNGEVFDEVEKIGEFTHHRFIVGRDRFNAKLGEKGGKAATAGRG